MGRSGRESRLFWVNHWIPSQKKETREYVDYEILPLPRQNVCNMHIWKTKNPTFSPPEQFFEMQIRNSKQAKRCFVKVLSRFVSLPIYQSICLVLVSINVYICPPIYQFICISIFVYASLSINILLICICHYHDFISAYLLFYTNYQYFTLWLYRCAKRSFPDFFWLN